jgi:ribosomal protein S18 acetylase RimI-like enzyme
MAEYNAPMTLADLTSPATTASPVEIRPARMDDAYAVLLLHREAFADKLGAAFGHEQLDTGVAAMAEAWRRQGPSALRGMLVAVVDNQVVGTTTLRTWEMGSDDSGAAEIAFHQVLGTWGALRATYTLSLLDHMIGRDEGYITDVAVLSSYRRRGIARALLQRAEDDARGRRKRYLSLYVSASNQAAHELYLHLGYLDRKLRRSLMTALLLKQHGWYFMQKPLS